MALCPSCKLSFKVPEGDHPAEHGCPRCGLPDEGDCPECGYRGHMLPTKRGVRVTWTKCPDCGEDIEKEE